MSGQSVRAWALACLVAGASSVAFAVRASPPRPGYRGPTTVEAGVALAAPVAFASAGREASPPPRDPGGDLAPGAVSGARADAAERDDGERFHYDVFLALASRGATPDWRAVLREEGPAYRKVALLRALRDADSPALADACAQALAELPLESDARGVSVPEFTVRLLGEGAARGPELRAVLHAAVFGPERVDDPGLRARAARALVTAAGRDDLVRIARELAVCEDPDLARVVARALTDGTIAPTMEHLFTGLALPEPAAVEDHE